MRASHYHKRHATEVQQLIGKYAHDTPLPNDDVSKIQWRSPTDEILCLDDIEKLAGLPFSDEEMAEFFDGTVKVASLQTKCETLNKYAKKLTPEEKAKRREYYQKNKERLKRKAKIRKRRQDSGSKIKRKRKGHASTGYTFVQDSSGPKRSQPSSSGPSEADKRKNYEPRESGSTRQKRKLQS